MRQTYDYSELADRAFATDEEVTQAKAEVEARQDALRGISAAQSKAAGRSQWEANIALGRLKTRQKAERAELAARHARELSDEAGK